MVTSALKFGSCCQVGRSPTSFGTITLFINCVFGHIVNNTLILFCDLLKNNKIFPLFIFTYAYCICIGIIHVFIQTNTLLQITLTINFTAYEIHRWLPFRYCNLHMHVCDKYSLPIYIKIFVAVDIWLQANIDIVNNLTGHTYIMFSVT